MKPTIRPSDIEFADEVEVDLEEMFRTSVIEKIEGQMKTWKFSKNTSGYLMTEPHVFTVKTLTLFQNYDSYGELFEVILNEFRELGWIIKYSGRSRNYFWLLFSLKQQE